jgi:hypothetical protein
MAATSLEARPRRTKSKFELDLRRFMTNYQKPDLSVMRGGVAPALAPSLAQPEDQCSYGNRPWPVDTHAGND